MLLDSSLLKKRKSERKAKTETKRSMANRSSRLHSLLKRRIENEKRAVSFC